MKVSDQVKNAVEAQDKDTIETIIDGSTKLNQLVGVKKGLLAAEPELEDMPKITSKSDLEEIKGELTLVLDQIDFGDDEEDLEEDLEEEEDLEDDTTPFDDCETIKELRDTRDSENLKLVYNKKKAYYNDLEAFRDALIELWIEETGGTVETAKKPLKGKGKGKGKGNGRQTNAYGHVVGSDGALIDSILEQGGTKQSFAKELLRSRKKEGTSTRLDMTACKQDINNAIPKHQREGTGVIITRGSKSYLKPVRT